MAGSVWESFGIVKTVKEPILFLAPMMDLTGWAFREMIRRKGGCDIFYSEMLNARRVPLEHDQAPMFKGFAQESDLIIQLLGNEPDKMAAAVRRLEVSFEPLGFDLNLGCSRAAILRHGWGAAMLKDAVLTGRVLAAMRRATQRPLSVKIRNGWRTPEETRAFLGMLETEGVDLVTVHPRSPEKIFTRPARWGWIGEVKRLLRVPVIGNGDVFTAEDAGRMVRETGCDGVMLGRGAVARPWLFREIRAAWEGGTPVGETSRLETFRDFIRLFGEEAGHPKRLREIKTFCQYFAQGLPVPHWFWGKIQGLHDSAAIIRTAEAYLEKNQL